jgi:hypothetical protein
LTVFAILVAAVTGAPAAGSPVAHRAATCSFAPNQHRLTINSSDLRVILSIRRQGEQLVVSQDGAPIACGGATPTVANVDAVSVLARTEFRVDLGGGPLAPGFTDEADGSSEIEIDAKFGRAGGLRVLGSRRKDRIVMGDRAGVHAVNLNGRERQRDADLSIEGGYPVLSVIGRGGNDRISARGGAGFAGPLSWQTTISAGAGRDRIKGSFKRDLIGGGAGADRIAPGKGTDRIKSLGGADRLRLRDRERDFARCGPGKDRVRADRKDVLLGCDTR